MKRESKTIVTRAAMLLLVAVLTFFACPNQARAQITYNVISGTQGNSYMDENGPIFEYCENLFDGDTNTKWCVNRINGYYDEENDEYVPKKFPLEVKFTTSSPIVPIGYILTTGNDIHDGKRNPTQWTLEASWDGTSWSELDEQDEASLPTTNKTSQFFQIDNSTEYKYFKLEIKAIRDGDDFELSEFQFITAAQVKDLSYATVEGLQPNYNYTGSAINLGAYTVKEVLGNEIASTNYTVVVKNSNDDVVSSIVDIGTYTLVISPADGSDYTGKKVVPFEVLPWGGVGGWCGLPDQNDGKNVYYEITNSDNVTTLTIRKNPAAASSDFRMFLYTPYDWDETYSDFAPWITAVPQYKNGVFDKYALSSDIEEVVIEEGVTSVGSGAFYYCKKLKTATIPASVTTIWDYAFHYCTALEDVYCYADPDALTWDLYEYCDFAADNATKFHVNNNQLAAYVNKFGAAQVTFVGEAPKTYIITVSVPDKEPMNSAVRELPYSKSFRECMPSSYASYMALGSITGITINSGNNVEIGELNSWDTEFTVTSPGTSTVTVTINDVLPVTFTISTTRTFEVTANNANGAYWATFYSSEGNFKVQTTGTEVFAVNLDGTTLTMNEISDGIVNQGKGVVLKGSASSIVLKEVTSASTDEDYGTNSLTGTDNGVVNPGNAFALGYSADNGVGFYKLTDTGIIGANKAFLTYDGTLDAREFFTFGQDANGIDATAIDHSPLTIDHYYDLQGRRVDHPTKGLYIINGKKVVVP